MAHWISLVLRLIVVAGLLYSVLFAIRWPPDVWTGALTLAHRFPWLYRLWLRRLAREAFRAQNFKIARDLARDAVRLHLHPISHVSAYDLLFLAQALYRSAHYHAAAAWLSVLDASTTDDYRMKPSILLLSAYANSALERHSAAESAVRRAETVPFGWDQWYDRRKLRSVASRWDLAMAKGYVAYAARRFDDALACFRTAMDLAGELRQHKQLATLNNLAAAATDAGDLSAAEKYVGQAARLGGRGAWSGQQQFLRTAAQLRIAQGRHADARALIDAMVASGRPTPAVRVLAAEVALADGSTKEALQQLSDLTPQQLDPFSRDHAATLLEQLGRIEAQNESPETVNELFNRAAALRLPPPAPTIAPEDQLLKESRRVLAGRKFAPLDPARAVILAGWLYFTFGLFGSVLFPWDPPLPLVIAQAGLLIFWKRAARPVNRILLGARPVRQETP